MPWLAAAIMVVGIVAAAAVVIQSFGNGFFSNDSLASSPQAAAATVDAASLVTDSDATTQTGASETGASDTASSDTASSDTASSDTASSDTASSDAASSDAASSDAASLDVAVAKAAASQTADSQAAVPETAAPETSPAETREWVLAGEVNHAHTSPVTRIVFSSNGKFAATVDQANAVQRWSVSLRPFAMTKLGAMISMQGERLGSFWLPADGGSVWAIDKARPGTIFQFVGAQPNTFTARAQPVALVDGSDGVEPAAIVYSNRLIRLDFWKLDSPDYTKSALEVDDAVATETRGTILVTGSLIDAVNLDANPFFARIRGGKTSPFDFSRAAYAVAVSPENDLAVVGGYTAASGVEYANMEAGKEWRTLPINPSRSERSFQVDFVSSADGKTQLLVCCSRADEDSNLLIVRVWRVQGDQLEPVPGAELRDVTATATECAPNSPHLISADSERLQWRMLK